MSYHAEGCYPVYDEAWIRKAHKAHICDACGEGIAAGSSYWRIFWVYADGNDTASVKRCERCQKVHYHLREKGAEVGSMWPDEWLSCDMVYEDEWGKMPPEIAELAFALPGEVDAGKPPR